VHAEVRASVLSKHEPFACVILAQLKAQTENTLSSDDDNLFAKMQQATYKTMLSTLKASNHRRRLVAGGKSFQRVIHSDAQALGACTIGARPPMTGRR